MYLITERTIDEFALRHPEIRVELGTWVAMVQAARWTSGSQAAETSLFHTRAISGGRLIFKIKGDDYRIVCRAKYAHQDPKKRMNGMVYVEFTGTHAEYNKIDAETVTMKIRRTS